MILAKIFPHLRPDDEKERRNAASFAGRSFFFTWILHRFELRLGVQLTELLKGPVGLERGFWLGRRRGDEQALAVPADALQRGNVVYVKDDSVTEAQGRVPAGFREVQVETGVINSDYVEIVSGDLQEGDQVYVSESSVSSTNSMMPMGGGNMGGMGGAMGGGNRPGGSSGGGPGGAGPGGSGRR